MTFNEIMKYLNEGKEVRRKGWEHPDYYICFSKGGYLRSSNLITPGITQTDLNADDWELYKEGFALDKAYQEGRVLKNIIY